MSRDRGDSDGFRVMLLAPNWLGDVVMTTPLISFLADLPELSDGRRVELVLGIRQRWAGLFQGDRRISEIMPLQRRGAHKGLGGLMRQAGQMRRSSCEAVVVCPPSLRAGMASFLAGIPLRIGQPSDGRSPLLTDRTSPAGPGAGHFSRQMLELGHRFAHTVLTGVPKEHWGELLPEVSLPACEAMPAAAVGDGPDILVFAPATTYGAAKTWPVARAAALLAAAVGDLGLRVLLVGDGAGRPFISALQGSCDLPMRRDIPGPAGVIDQVGATDLPQVVGLLGSAVGFIGNDSGLMHLAAALGVPTVGVFGSSSADWTAPLGPRTAVVAASGFPCQPCFRQTCNQDLFCLDSVGADQVLETWRSIQGCPGVTPEVGP